MKTRLSVISIIFVLVLLLASGIMSAAEYDFGGDTITYMHAGEEFEDGDDAAYLESVEEDFNVNIEFLDWPWQEQRDSLIPGIMAGDPPADVYHWSYGWTWQQNVVAQGGLYPLDNILDEDYYNSIPEFEREFVKEYTTFNNETLGFYSKAQGAVRFIMWNKDMFERENLPDLYELYENGEWTWDQFEEILEQVTKDTTGDNEINQYGYGSAFGAEQTISYWTPIFFAYNNGGAMNKQIDGRRVFTMDEPEFVQALEFIKDLGDRDLLSPQSAGAATEQFIEGELAMLETNWWDFGEVSENMEDEYGLMMLPKGPNGDHVAVDRGDVGFFALPLTVDRPEALVNLTNALFELTDDYMDVDDYFNQRIEDISMYLQDRESIGIYEDILFNRKVIALREPIWPVMRDIRLVLGGEQSAQAAMTALEAEAQPVIDDYLGQ